MSGRMSPLRVNNNNQGMSPRRVNNDYQGMSPLRVNNNNQGMSPRRMSPSRIITDGINVDYGEKNNQQEITNYLDWYTYRTDPDEIYDDIISYLKNRGESKREKLLYDNIIRSLNGEEEEGEYNLRNAIERLSQIRYPHLGRLNRETLMRMIRGRILREEDVAKILSLHKKDLDIVAAIIDNYPNVSDNVKYFW